MIKNPKQKKVCLVLDLEPDHAGLVPRKKYYCWEPKRIVSLINLLKKHRAKLSIFVVASSLEENKKTIELFEKYKADFYLHSYSHNIKNPDSIFEIRKGKEAFEKFFDESPKGYRAPFGLITESGLMHLGKEGFEFDASIIPSFWPTIKYLKYPNEPFFIKDNLLEIPFSTISPARLSVSLSWIKLFEPALYKFLFSIFKNPNLLVFPFHLHDLWVSPSYDKLPLGWKLKYVRHQNKGLEILDDFLSFLKSRNYTFASINEIVKDTKKI